MDEKSCRIFDIFSLLRKLNGLNKERVENLGLNNLESIILFHIDKIDRLTQKDLVKRLKMPKQTINSIILNLKEKDLISMQALSSDKRVKILVLTEAGELEVEKINQALSISDGQIYDSLGEDKIGSIAKNLEELIDAIEENLNKELI